MILSKLTGCPNTQGLCSELEAVGRGGAAWAEEAAALVGGYLTVVLSHCYPVSLSHFYTAALSHRHTVTLSHCHTLLSHRHLVPGETSCWYDRGVREAERRQRSPAAALCRGEDVGDCGGRGGLGDHVVCW